jgi:hypothetical protein
VRSPGRDSDHHLEDLATDFLDRRLTIGNAARVDIHVVAHPLVHGRVAGDLHDWMVGNPIALPRPVVNAMTFTRLPPNL